MPFDDIEASQEQGKPITFYAFTLGFKTWRYTSSEVDREMDGELWTSIAISDDGVKQTGEATTDATTIDAPATIGPAQLYMSTPPAQPIFVRMFQAHADDNEFVACYAGEISQVTFPFPGKCRVICETLSASMQREGLRLGWQRACPYAVYDPLTCKVDKAAWAVDARVLSIEGFVVTADVEFSDEENVFAGGFIEWQNPVRGLDFRGIELQSGAELTIFGSMSDIYVGMRFKAYPGCKNTVAACQDFGNYDNYGGIPPFPGKSPFNGDPVF